MRSDEPPRRRSLPAIPSKRPTGPCLVPNSVPPAPEGTPGLDRVLVTRRSLFLGVVASLIAVWMAAGNVATHGTVGLFNDFYPYWASVKLLAGHHDPYDVVAAWRVLARAGIPESITLGYTYPALLGYLMLPLSWLPPLPAAVLFSITGLVAFTLAVALLVAPLGRLPWAELALLAAGAGTFVPITGSLFIGQANLLVLLPLALAFRGTARAGALALATAVKLYPVVGLLAFLPRSSRDRRQLLIGAAGAVVLTVLPNLLSGAHSPHFAQMFTPDAYFTNQSVNGFLSRLAGGPWRTAPPLLPHLEIERLMIAICVALGALTMTVVLLVRGAPWDGCLALLLVYGSIAAPRNSLWNFAPLLLGMAWCWPRVRHRPHLLAVLLAAWALIELQAKVFEGGPGLQSDNAWLGLLGSIALYGAVLLGGLIAYLLLADRHRPPEETQPEEQVRGS